VGIQELLQYLSEKKKGEGTLGKEKRCLNGCLSLGEGKKEKEGVKTGKREGKTRKG